MSSDLFPDTPAVSLLATQLPLQGLRGPGQQRRGGGGQAAGRPLQVTQQDQSRTDNCAQGTHPAGQLKLLGAINNIPSSLPWTSGLVPNVPVCSQAVSHLDSALYCVNQDSKQWQWYIWIHFVNLHLDIH